MGVLSRWMMPLTAFVATSAASLNITVYRPDLAFAPTPLPPSHSESDGDEVVSLFRNLGRSTTWSLISAVPFQGDTYEPEGIVRLGPDRYVVSAGEYTEATVKYNQTINGTDRTAGAGFAHMMVFSGNGTRIADATLTKPGDLMYHNGGLDFDGQGNIWATLAQYRPNSTARVVTIDPYTMQSQTVLHHKDHLGGIVHDVRRQKITALNWGSRNATTWDLNPDYCYYHYNHNLLNNHIPDATTTTKNISTLANPSHFVDYQDCKFLGHSTLYHDRPVMLCSGVATIGDVYSLGGIAIVDVETMMPLMEVPIALSSDLGVRITQNPVDCAVVDGRLRLFWLPDQHNSTLYIYEAVP